MLVQASSKKKSAVLGIFFNKTFQLNLLRLPNTKILNLTLNLTMTLHNS